MNNFGKIVFVGLVSLLAASETIRAASRLDGTAAFTRGNHIDAANKARPLAERGDARAQTMLGFMHEHGLGVARDYVAAVYWYTCAAQQGHPTAEYLLGLMYNKGHGVVRSDVLAYKWLNLAAAHAQPGTREYYLRIRNAVAAKLSASQVAEAQWLASGFFPIPQR